MATKRKKRSTKRRSRTPRQSAVPAGVKICAEPETRKREFEPNVGPHRERLILSSDRKWANGTKLHYCFLDSPASMRGTAAHKRKVQDAFDAWKQVGIGLNFEKVNAVDEAEIRIGFKRNDGHWSYIGRDVLGIAQSDPTLNLDQGDNWDLDTAMHEIGHTLGFPHEHQNPRSGIVWNEEAVYDALAQPPNNWSRETTHHNIIRKLDPGEVTGSAWDRNSVMHYPFEAGLIDRPTRYRTQPLTPAGGLSVVDQREVKSFYPPLTLPGHRTLKPFQFVRLSLRPRQQADFIVRPTATRSYRFSTFGQSDTVMVLFEDVNGSPRYRRGDDDSGFDRNASIEERLFAGRTYYLRVRLYYRHRHGDFGTMMW